VAEVSVEIGHPDTRFMHLAHAGFWSGHRPLLCKTRSISVTAHTDLLWAQIPKRATERLLAEHPGHWRHIALMVDMSNETAMQITVDLAKHNGIARVAATLPRVAGCRIHNPDLPDALVIRVSQEDIAALAVMSRNTLGSYFAELAQHNLIEIGYRSVRLTNPTVLWALLEPEE
jgi:CRP-like cAMP-binding protein